MQIEIQRIDVITVPAVFFRFSTFLITRQAGAKAREQYKAPQQPMPSTSTHDCNDNIETTFGVSPQSKQEKKRKTVRIRTDKNTERVVERGMHDECSTCSSDDSSDDEDDYADFLSSYYASVRAHQHKKNAGKNPPKTNYNSGTYALKTLKIKRYNSHAVKNNQCIVS